VVGNVGDAEVTGADLDLKALLGDSFEIGVNFTKLNDSFVKAPEFYVEPRVDGGLIETGLDRDAQGRASLPLFPKTSYSLYGTLRDINILGGNGVLTLQHQHVGRSLNQLQFPLPQGDYSTTDLLFNLDYSNWSAQLYVRNLSDERGIMYEDSQDFDQYFGWNSSFVIRPRSFGISLRRYF
jgi:outer membrane receptor protein involved in Fe transport